MFEIVTFSDEELSRCGRFVGTRYLGYAIKGYPKNEIRHFHQTQW